MQSGSLADSLSKLRVLVGGFGISGKAIAEVLSERAKSFAVYDAVAPEADFQQISDITWQDFQLLVVSPGIPPSSELVVTAQKNDIMVISEVELAWWLRVDNKNTGVPAPWLLVTGTNGKTTTVQLTSAMLDAAGKQNALVGNVGTPIVKKITDPSIEVFVVELSSFQLHFSYSLVAEAAVITNLAPDHLDWHGGYQNYVADKAKVFADARTAIIFDSEQTEVLHLAEEAEVAEGARAVAVTVGAPAIGQLGVIDGIAADRSFHAELSDRNRSKFAAELFELADLKLLAGGDNIPRHLVKNALMAAALVRSVGVPASAVKKALQGFNAQPHRIQFLGKTDANHSKPGVSFVNDSKATNPHAAAASLTSFPDNSVVWIVGGLAKGVNYDEIVAQQLPKLSAVVVIGVDQTDISSSLQRHAANVPTVFISASETKEIMVAAVEAAVELAATENVVLLAPASASMDQFTSYEDRGNQFIAAVTDYLQRAE